MKYAALIFTGLIALEHLFIMYMEMFAWNTLGRKTFKGALPDELFAETVTMAANQGLYNGFLAAGLIWSFFISDAAWSSNVAVFFLCCVIAAGLYGAATLTNKILFTQAIPAAIALVLVYLAR